MIPTPTIASSPIAWAITTRIGANGINVFTPFTVQINVKILVSNGIRTQIVLEYFFTTFAIADCSAPLTFTKRNAPPENTIHRNRATPSLKPLAMWFGIVRGFTGVRATKEN